jgi:hypothetical protein
MMGFFLVLLLFKPVIFPPIRVMEWLCIPPLVRREKKRGLWRNWSNREREWREFF